MGKREEAVMALEEFYRSTDSSGVRAKLQWKAVLAMNAYYKYGDASVKKREMQAVIDRLEAETGEYTVPHFTPEERAAAVEEYGGEVDLGAFNPEPVMPKPGINGLIVVAVVALVGAIIMLFRKK